MFGLYLFLPAGRNVVRWRSNKAAIPAENRDIWKLHRHGRDAGLSEYTPRPHCKFSPARQLENLLVNNIRNILIPLPPTACQQTP